jgi:hypothetical protein
MDRREFVTRAAGMLFVVPFGTFLLHCSSDKSSRAEGTEGLEGDETPPAAKPRTLGSNIVYTSSTTEGHSHAFSVASSAFENPPLGGILGRTTAAGGHQHRVEVSVEALRRAADGDIVKIETIDDSGHMHVFTVVKIA